MTKANTHFTMSHQPALVGKTLKQSQKGTKVMETATIEAAVMGSGDGKELFCQVRQDGISHLMTCGDFLGRACGKLVLSNVTHMHNCKTDKMHCFAIKGTMLAHAHCKKHHKEHATLGADPVAC